VLDLSWQVLDPGRFVESGHRNVPATLIGELQSLDGGASCAAAAGKTDTHIAPTAATAATAGRRPARRMPRRGLGIVSM
ncbi:hypothetical protein AB0L42_07505, partial [Streptomyces sp. NPDC052287]